jgi:lysophospholipase L1-like esterase
MLRRFIAWSLLASLSLVACTGARSSVPSPQASSPVDAEASASPSTDPAALEAAYRDPLRLVTLGDGYTFGGGTASPTRDGWPGQLVQAMRDRPPRLRLVHNLADHSQTSFDVLSGQLPQVESLKPDVVTVQVGVNDILRTVSLDDYRSNVSDILDELLLILPPGRIFVITTPDHTLTEGGLGWTPRDVGSALVREVNVILTEVATERDIAVVDISPVNALVAVDPSLVIGQGPNPTAKQYAGWVEVIGQHIQGALMAVEP